MILSNLIKVGRASFILFGAITRKLTGHFLRRIYQIKALEKLHIRTPLRRGVKILRQGWKTQFSCYTHLNFSMRIRMCNGAIGPNKLDAEFGAEPRRGVGGGRGAPLNNKKNFDGKMLSFFFSFFFLLEKKIYLIQLQIV